MARPPSPLFFFFILAFFLISSFSSAQRRTYIIRVDRESKPSIFPTHLHWYSTTLSSIELQEIQDQDPQGQAASPIIHTYESIFHGFSARIFPSTADTLATVPGVVAVIPEQIREIHTTRSPQFLGLKSSDTSGLLADTDYGSDLVVGVIDTGIFPERRSFSDSGLGPVPTRWKGQCVAGKGFDPAVACNRKLIGARFFAGGYEATSGKMNETLELRSPRDTDGHGTHTASIAVGRYVFPASTLGYARGVASGMAPKARVAAYKVCWAAGCFDSDILAAFDSAVADGVDVISLSVGGVVVPYYLDAIAVGAFAAAEAGVFVSASAGNGGPGEVTVTNVAPWVTTVGAGSMDRDFPTDIKLGNGVLVQGVSIYSGPGLAAGRLYKLVYAGAEGGGDGYSSSLCLEGSLDTKVVKNTIVLCDRGINSRAEKGEVVRKAGGIGMIIANGAFDGEGLIADSHVLPATSVGATVGSVIRKYIATSTPQSPSTATIEFHGTRLGVHPAPVVASFSARGPNPQTPEILKPDLIAPGLNILAAWPDNIGPAGIPSDTRRTEFNILSGTSMACPHVSGLAALLKAANPAWSPAAIRSALMTTAYTGDNRNTTMLDESTGNSTAGVMDFGAGHVNPPRAMDPGLVYDLTMTDYINFMCNLNYTQQNIRAITRRPADCVGARKFGHVGNLNYPSFSAVFVQDGRRSMSTHFLRTVTNVGSADSVYRAEVVVPEGSVVEVEPTQLMFRRIGQKLNFLLRVKVTAEGVKLESGTSRVKSGTLTWSDGKHTVRSPIVVTLQAPVV